MINPKLVVLLLIALATLARCKSNEEELQTKIPIDGHKNESNEIQSLDEFQNKNVLLDAIRSKLNTRIDKLVAILRQLQLEDEENDVQDEDYYESEDYSDNDLDDFDFQNNIPKKRSLGKFNQKFKNFSKTKKISLDLFRRNSLYNTLPIDTAKFERAINEFVNRNKMRNKKSNAPKSYRKVQKKAACGNLNGTPMYRWMCW